jgi:hypothetical protein
VRVGEVVPLGLLGHPFAGHEPQDHVQSLGHAVPLLERVDAHHQGVALEQARASTEHDAAAGLVIELDHAVRDHQRVVVGQRHDAETEFQMLRALRGRGDEELRRRDQLEAAGMMLADPRLGESELVDPLHQLEVAMDEIGGVLVDGVMRAEKDSIPEIDVAHRAWIPCLGAGPPSWAQHPAAVKDMSRSAV